MKKIAEWLVDCKQRYPVYLKEQEERRKERNAKRKRAIKTAGRIVGGILTVVAAILGGKKIAGK